MKDIGRSKLAILGTGDILNGRVVLTGTTFLRSGVDSQSEDGQRSSDEKQRSQMAKLVCLWQWNFKFSVALIAGGPVFKITIHSSFHDDMMELTEQLGMMSIQQNAANWFSTLEPSSRSCLEPNRTNQIRIVNQYIIRQTFSELPPCLLLQSHFLQKRLLPRHPQDPSPLQVLS